MQSVPTCLLQMHLGKSDSSGFKAGVLWPWWQSTHVLHKAWHLAETSLGIRRWTVNWRDWGRLTFLSAEAALAGNLWHWNGAGSWDGSAGNCCSQSSSGRALSDSFGLSFQVKAVVLTHTEVVGRGKQWRNCVASHFKMLWGSQNFWPHKQSSPAAEPLRVNRRFMGHWFQSKACVFT